MINWQPILDRAILIREFEHVIQHLYSTDCIQSPVHLSIGQELTSCLIAHFYKNDDYLVGNYRSHALTLSVADNFDPLILELLAKKGGISGGKAGSMHLSVPSKNLMWTSAIVGSGVPLAAGMAETLKRTSDFNVATVLFGDGAIEEGCVLETINLASTFNLPMVFVLEDNALAIHTRKDKRTSLSSYTDLSQSYGINSFNATYKDPVDLYNTFSAAYDFSRSSRKPSFVCVECFRWTEHVGVGHDWDLGYRSSGELTPWLNSDIITHPEHVGLSKEFVLERSNHYYNYFLMRFETFVSSPDPDPCDLLTNVN